jgi:hypothetical protein
MAPGGTGHGEVAAQAVIDAVTQGAPAGRAWSALLEELDRDGARLGHGQTPAVVLSATRRAITAPAPAPPGPGWFVTHKPLVGPGCRPFAVHATGSEPARCWSRRTGCCGTRSRRTLHGWPQGPISTPRRAGSSSWCGPAPMRSPMMWRPVALTELAGAPLDHERGSLA